MGDMCYFCYNKLNSLPLPDTWKVIHKFGIDEIFECLDEIEKRIDLVMRNVGCKKLSYILHFLFDIKEKQFFPESIFTPLGYTHFSAKTPVVIMCENASKKQIEEDHLSKWLTSQLIYDMIKNVFWIKYGNEIENMEISYSWIP